MTDDMNTNVTVRLRHEMHYSNGRNEGFIFAINCQADKAAIIAEIEEVKQRIYELLQDNPTGSMAKGSGPRSFRDGYISALEDTLQIIDEQAKVVQ